MTKNTKHRSSRWWLTQGRAAVVIDAARGAHLRHWSADLPRMGEWSPECRQRRVGRRGQRAGRGRHVRRPQPGRTARLMRWSRHGRVLDRRPGPEFAFVTEEGGRESTEWRYRFEPVEGGTRVTESYEVQWIPRGPASSTSRPTAPASCARPCGTRSSSSRRAAEATARRRRSSSQPTSLRDLRRFPDA